MEFDVVVVGAGPAGLSAAIRLKQLAAESGREVSVVVLEKGSEVGAHILSGAVIDPKGLNRLIPDWKAKGAPVSTEVREDRFLVLGPAGDIRLPNIPDAAADEQSRQLHREPGRADALARRAGGGVGRRDLSGFCRCRGALRREGPRDGRGDRRHGRRPRWQAQGQLHARHGVEGQVHARSPRARAARCRSSSSPSSSSTPAASRRSTASASRSCGR